MRDKEWIERSTTTDGRPVDADSPYGAPAPIDPATGQHESYYVLTKEERAKGFVRPVRRTYTHNACGTSTSVGLALAETCAADPKYYGSTFCVACRSHFPVAEFTWDDGTVVGS
jgi:hypothetical protein